jgi:AsmA protein
MRGWLRTGLIGAAALGTAMAAALAALVFVVPAEVYKQPIERAVGRATGRAFTIAGPLHFALFPAPGLRAERIALAGLASAEGMRIAVAPWPLLAGRIEITEIVLEKPVIALAIDGAGRPNWILARPAQALARGGKPRSGPEIEISRIRLEHARLTYSNPRIGATRALDDLDATVASGAAQGAFAYGGRRVGFTASTPDPHAVLSGRPAAVTFVLTSPLAQAKFSGVLAPNGRADGHLALATPSLHDAGTWLGAVLPDHLRALSLASDIHGDGRTLALSKLTATLDGAHLAGDLGIDTHGKVPRVTGRLSIDRLDVDPYIQAPRKAAGPPRPRRDDDGWSKEPVSLDVLTRLDADLGIDAGAVAVKSLKLGKTHMSVTLEDGKLRAVLGPMALYGGSGSATLAVDAKAHAFRNAATFANVALAPFLTDTMGVKQIEGTGTIRLDVASRGATPDAIMRGLSGSGAIDFRDGRLTGVDLGAMARTIQAMLGAVEGQGAFTDYATMQGRFTLANGVLEAQDFALDGPLIRTTGAGKVDIANRSIDFRIVPQLAKVKLGVPFRIEGPWRHVRYRADLAGLAESLLDALRGRPKPPGQQKKKHKSVEEAIKNMLGIH